MAYFHGVHVTEISDIRGSGGSTSVSLIALAMSGALRVGVATSGTISGGAIGSLIAGNLPGITVDSINRTYAGTPTGAAGTIAAGLVETLAGALNSPFPTSITILPALATVSLAADVSKAEGNSGANLYTFTVTRSAAIGAVSVTWTFSPGGTSAADYTGGALPAGGTVTLADGVSSGTFTVSVNGDADVEPDEQFTVAIVAPSGYALGAKTSASGAIVNDDSAPAPTVTLSADVSKAEGNSGASLYAYTVTRSAVAGAVNIVWSFAAGGTSAADYTGGVLPTGGTVALADGVASGAFSVSVNGDTDVEPDETFTVSIAAPSGYALGAKSSATGGIVNDDSAPAPTVTLSADVSKAEGNSGANLYTFTVSRSASTGAISVPWGFAAGGTSAADFTGGVLPAGGTVALADGMASGAFSVSVNGDTDVEPDETFTVSITAPSGYALGAKSSAIGGIVNDDSVQTSTVSGLTMMGDMPIAITNPAALTIPMQTNGRVLRIATTTSLTTAALDLSKVTLTVVDQGWGTDGAQVARGRTIGLREFLRGPHAETGYYQPTTGIFHVVLDDHVHNQDATWRTTIQSVNFASNWLPGAPAETVTTVTRNDSLAYFPFPVKAFHHPFERVAANGAYRTYWQAISKWSRNRSPLACVEAWAVDSAGTPGAIARTSTWDWSTLTPATGTPGQRMDNFEVDVSFNGLAGGPAGVRGRFKPWIGPMVETFSYGEAYPTLNLFTETRVMHDADASYVPLFGVLVHDPAAPPSGKTLIASNTTISSADVSGLALTQAAAEASNKVYADPASLAAAVRRVNASATALTLASGSYKRPTPHDDCDAMVAVCPSVAGSALGQDAGAYSMRINAPMVSNYVLPEIRSASGLPSDDVRWRGRNSDGTAPTGKSITPRLRLRGITKDSTGVAAAADNVIFNMGTTPPTAAAASELVARCTVEIDCRTFEPTDISTGTNVPISGQGYVFHRRCEHRNISSNMATMNNATYFAGIVSSVGSLYHARGFGGVSMMATAFAGTRLIDIPMAGQSAGVQPDTWGHLVSYLHVSTTATAPGTALIQTPSFRTRIKGSGFLMCFGHAPLATSYSGPMFSIHADGSRQPVDACYIQHVGGDAPLIKPDGTFSSDARANWGYIDQSAIRIDKPFFIAFCAPRSWHIKGDDFLAPELWPTNQWSSSGGYSFAAIVSDGGIVYQALQAVPAGTALTDTAYWYNTGSAPGSAIGKRSERQGNADLRYHIGSKGNVTSGTASGETVPQPSSMLGLKWGADEQTNANYAEFYADRANGDYRAKTGGPLRNRVAAGAAVTAHYLNGQAMANDGSDPAGAYGPFS